MPSMYLTKVQNTSLNSNFSEQMSTFFQRSLASVTLMVFGNRREGVVLLNQYRFLRSSINSLSQCRNKGSSLTCL